MAILLIVLFIYGIFITYKLIKSCLENTDLRIDNFCLSDEISELKSELEKKKK